MENLSVEDLKKFIIKLRKKQRLIEEKMMFCKDHNFHWEYEAKKIQCEMIQTIIHEIQREFHLGFVWDKSLND